MWTMAKWRHPRTRDGRLTVFIVLPTGAIDTDDGIKTELMTSEQLQLSISWPPALLNAEGIMNALLSFSEDLCDGQGLLLAQGIRDFTDPLDSEVGEDVVSTCTIPLPFPVKPDYDEDVTKFNGDSTTTYVLRFHAFEQRFASTKKKIMVRNIDLNKLKSTARVLQSTGSVQTISESKNNEVILTSVVTSS